MCENKVSTLYSTHFRADAEPVTRASRHTHTLVFTRTYERSQSTTTTHTHTARATALPPTHRKVEEQRSALWCHSLQVWCQKPCVRHCEQRRGRTEDRERRSKLWDNCASCIINMDGTLTLCARLICVSIPLAAVQTSPGFTVHWLLQNYSSSM